MRQRFMFWLDHDKPQEKHIAEDIQTLKQAGKFARTIRDGIRLIIDLRQGHTEILNELFPWVLEHKNVAPTEEPKDAIQQQLERLETLLLAQGAKPIVPINFTAELEDDDLELEITEVSHDENNRSDWNFMLASAMQVQGNCDSLPQEIIAYGLRTGRITSRDVTPTDPKAMNVPQFDAPTFDDLDLALDTG